jgi:hypothetical protein
VAWLLAGDKEACWAEAVNELTVLSMLDLSMTFARGLTVVLFNYGEMSEFPVSLSRTDICLPQPCKLVPHPAVALELHAHLTKSNGWHIIREIKVVPEMAD